MSRLFFSLPFPFFQLRSQLFQQFGQDSLGHAPDHGVVEPIGGEHATLAADVELDRVVGVRMQEEVERDPSCRRDLGIEGKLGTMVEREDIGPDGDGREQRRPWHHVVEGAYQMLGTQDQSDFFGGLPDGGGHQVGVAGILPAARNRHVSRPGVARSLGAPDQKNRVRVGRDDDRDRGPHQGIAALVQRRPVAGEPIAELIEPGSQWLWVWQPPPQHPPAGGPNRLKSEGLPLEAGRAVSDMSRSSLCPWHLGQATLVSDRTSWSNSA
jgi:hypothetical protein